MNIILKMGKKIYGLLASVAIAIILLFVYLHILNLEYKQSSVVFQTDKGEVRFNVEIADTYTERALGLMNRENLSEKSGMLFVFGDESERSFWMKNTLISLDIVFISEKKEIVYIQQAQPCKTLDCPSYSSKKPAKYVVEINGGLSDRLGIKEGDLVEIKVV